MCLTKKQIENLAQWMQGGVTRPGVAAAQVHVQHCTECAVKVSARSQQIAAARRQQQKKS